MSLWIGIIIVVLTLIIFSMLLRILKHTANIGNKLGDWDKKRKQQKSAELTTLGFCQLAEADWKKAEDNLKKGINGSATPLVNYLSAAQAAHCQGAYDRRDTYLRQAHKAMSSMGNTIDLAKIQFHLDAKEYPLAMQHLRLLNKQIPNHPLTLKLLHFGLLATEDWEKLTELLPRLRKHNALPENDINALEEKLAIALLSKTDTAENLKEAWSDIPKAAKTNTNVTAAFARKAIHQQCGSIAISAIENTLKKHWDAGLVKYYGLIKSENSAKQLNVAESWLKKHPDEAELLLCLGRLNQQEKFWGKAKDYLEAAAQLKPSSQIYNELARVYESLDEHEAAFKSYQKSAQLAECCHTNKP